MENNKIMLKPFRKAVESLRKALAQPKNEFTRDAAIQRFEYTFELAWKTIKRHLREESAVDEYNIKNLFRQAGRLGLINNVDHWFVYHTARNLTSHTYNEQTAEETYDIVQKFLPDVEDLLNKFEKIYANTTQ